MVVADMCFPVDFLAKFQATLFGKAFRRMNPDKLLIEFTCPVMQAAEGVHISLMRIVGVVTDSKEAGFGVGIGGTGGGAWGVLVRLRSRVQFEERH
jgi:hypothetical protein